MPNVLDRTYGSFVGFFLILFAFVNDAQTLDFQYHSYHQMTNFLQSIVAQFPNQAALYEIGKSTQGRSLWAVALSAYAPRDHILMRPEVKYIGNMHGNEVVGFEMLLHLIEYLLTSTDPQVRLLMQRSRIWIMPSMNPDGLAMSEYGDCSSNKGRLTSTNIDLNRNFPDYFEINPSSTERAPETRAIMDWLSKIHFVLSANYHGGAFIINIPYDRYYFGKVSISADDDIYQMFARSYINRISETSRYCDTSNDEVGTITRGADWYEVIGGMQDYGYLNYGTLEMTMEISCCKYPFSNILANYWSYNRDAMIELLLQAQRGIRGLILDEYYRPIPWTQVMINDRRPVINVTPLGEFWRVLLPGIYTFKVFYRGYEIYRQQVTVVDALVSYNLTILIPTSVYQPLTSRTAQILSPFPIKSFGNQTTIVSLSTMLFFLSSILFDNQMRKRI